MTGLVSGALGLGGAGRLGIGCGGGGWQSQPGRSLVHAPTKFVNVVVNVNTLTVNLLLLLLAAAANNKLLLLAAPYCCLLLVLTLTTIRSR